MTKNGKKAFSPQKRTSTTSKHEISQLIQFFGSLLPSRIRIQSGSEKLIESDLVLNIKQSSKHMLCGNKKHYILSNSFPDIISTKPSPTFLRRGVV
jgi:hypothetical protein